MSKLPKVTQLLHYEIVPLRLSLLCRGKLPKDISKTLTNLLATPDKQSSLPRHHLVGERLVLDVPVVHEREGHHHHERREVLRIENEVIRLGK